MKPKPPVIVTELFEPERSALLEFLHDLKPEAWSANTACEGWSVKDVATHILHDDFRNLSGGRDQYSIAHFDPPSWDALVAFVNRANQAWIDAARFLSPRLLVELLLWSGQALAGYFATADLMEPQVPVAWAGEGLMPHWLHIAREYTERWAHQQQIREGAGAPLLTDPRLFHSVLDTYVHALPHTYRDVGAKDSAHIVVSISGDAGGSWSLVRNAGAWGLYEDVDLPVTASVTVDQDRAWRIFTRAAGSDICDEGVVFWGATDLAARFLKTKAIIA